MSNLSKRAKISVPFQLYILNTAIFLKVTELSCTPNMYYKNSKNLKVNHFFCSLFSSFRWVFLSKYPTRNSVPLCNSMFGKFFLIITFIIENCEKAKDFYSKKFCAFKFDKVVWFFVFIYVSYENHVRSSIIDLRQCKCY